MGAPRPPKRPSPPRNVMCPRSPRRVSFLIERGAVGGRGRMRRLIIAADGAEPSQPPPPIPRGGRPGAKLRSEVQIGFAAVMRSAWLENVRAGRLAWDGGPVLFDSSFRPFSLPLHSINLPRAC